MKKKDKGHRELEELRGENRRLRKLLKYYKRRQNKEEPAEEEEMDLDKCPECGKGEILATDFKFIVIETCNLCPYEKKHKI